MSLINKMLRDLDKRHATQGGMEATVPGRLAEHVRPVSERGIASDWFWRSVALLMLFALGWVAWLVWQLMPRPAVTELAYQSSREKISAPNAEVPAPVAPAPAAPAEASPSVPSPMDAVAAVAVAQPAATPPPERVVIDMLRLATELTTPIPERSAKPSPSRAAPEKPSRAEPTKPSRAEPRKPTSVAQSVPVQPAAASEPAESGKINRRENTNPRDRAENEFRRALNLVNQGRIAEGMDGLRSALKIDPRHEATRQTLVALSLETKRVDEAASLLEQGLALNAGNSGFAMVLARILVEREDLPAALSLLQKHPAPPDRNPDFHAFSAALFQRLERHPEAIDQYRAALGIAPAVGVWWIGLGISYQASRRPKEALEAFAQAKAAGNLTPELASFVEQRLKQAQ